MPLLIAPLAQTLKIIAIRGDSKTKARLETLGLVKDSELSLLSVEKSGAIIKIKDTRLALDQKTASSVVVAII